MPIDAAPANPASVRARAMSANRGAATRSTALTRAGVPRSLAKKRRNTRYSTAITTSQGSAMSRAKPTNVSPLAAKASRLVRFDTGRRSDAELARWVHAYTCGLARTPSFAAVANTTGVSRTMVASRLSAAVTVAARTNTTPSRRWGEAWLTRAATPPRYVNTPSAFDRWDSTRMAARNPTVGPSAASSFQASDQETSPISTATTAAGTAIAASGNRAGRATANARTMARSPIEATVCTTSETTGAGQPRRWQAGAVASQPSREPRRRPMVAAQ